MTGQHTPGPWFFEYRGRIIAEVGGRPVWADKEAPISEVEAQANARLVAAAPDGLSANREALDFIQSFFGPVSNDDPKGWSDEDARKVAEQLRAAIAKAEGHS